MKERPILFSGPEVRAILDGRKTMTRRVVKPRKSPPHRCIDDDGWPCTDDEYGEWHRDRCPFGIVGDRLWVRETFCQIPNAKPSGYFSDPNWVNRVAWYAADNDKPTWGGPWQPSVHMPRWASRLTLEIVGVRVERLQDILPCDVQKEGCPYRYSGTAPEDAPDWKGWYRDLWNQINGPGSWDANPFVWCIEFRRVDK